MDRESLHLQDVKAWSERGTEKKSAGRWIWSPTTYSSGVEFAPNYINNHIRECLGIYVDRSIKGRDAVNELNRLRHFEGAGPSEFKLTTDQSLSRRNSIGGPMSTMSFWISAGLENRQMTH